jgi:hypothetical protein
MMWDRCENVIGIGRGGAACILLVRHLFYTGITMSYGSGPEASFYAGTQRGRVGAVAKLLL